VTGRRRGVAAAIAVGLAAVLAPAAGAAKAAPALHSVAAALPFSVTAADGTALRGHVYLPDGPGPFATVLELSPYWGTTYPRSGEATVTDDDGRTTLWNWLAPFLDNGFAVALVNARGTDRSEGCLQWGTEIDAHDGALVVETLAAQPWANGRVGMIGHSYPAWLAYLALTEAPPSLGAIAIASGIIDPWNLMSRHGAAFSLAPATPAISAALTTGAIGLNGPAGPSTMMETPPSHVACPRYADDAVATADLLATGDRSPYWQGVDLRGRIRGTTVPVLVANGLRQEGHILQVDGLWELLAGDRRMVLGQWNHQWPHTAGHTEWQQQMVDWFAYHLRGEPRTVRSGVVEFQDDAGAWHRARTWPPPARVQTVQLSGGALLPSGAAVDAGVQTFRSQDYDPVPASCPDRQALFVSPPLAEDVVVAGAFTLDVTVTSTLPDGNLAALLFHSAEVVACPDPQAPSGSPLDGYLLAPLEVRRALADLRHAGGVEQGRLFPLGAPTAVSIRSHPFASRIRAGERLILAVGGGARELFPDARKPVLTVSTGPGVAGALRLPVISGRLRFAPS
jgi:predicted acyl esterase